MTEIFFLGPSKGNGRRRNGEGERNKFYVKSNKKIEIDFFFFLPLFHFHFSPLLLFLPTKQKISIYLVGRNWMRWNEWQWKRERQNREKEKVKLKFIAQFGIKSSIFLLFLSLFLISSPLISFHFFKQNILSKRGQTIRVSFL